MGEANDRRVGQDGQGDGGSRQLLDDGDDVVRSGMRVPATLCSGR